MVRGGWGSEFVGFVVHLIQESPVYRDIRYTDKLISTYLVKHNCLSSFKYNPLVRSIDHINHFQVEEK